MLGKFRMEGNCNYPPGLTLGGWSLSALPQPFLPPFSNRAGGSWPARCAGKVEPVEGALAVGTDMRGGEP